MFNATDWNFLCKKRKEYFVSLVFRVLFNNRNNTIGLHSKYTKSRKLRLKSSRKGKRASERNRRASRGCSRQFTKKYSQRNSPPYPANNCCGSVKRGNDRKIYKSIQRTKASPCVWKRVAMN